MMLAGSRLVLTAAIYEVTMQRIEVLVVELGQKLREIDEYGPVSGHFLFSARQLRKTKRRQAKPQCRILLARTR